MTGRAHWVLTSMVNDDMDKPGVWPTHIHVSYSPSCANHIIQVDSMANAENESNPSTSRALKQPPVPTRLQTGTAA